MCEHFSDHKHCAHARHNRILPSLVAIITSSTFSPNIGSCGVKSHGPDQTPLLHNCNKSMMLVASPLSMGSFNLKSRLITEVNQVITYNIQQRVVITVHNHEVQPEA